jgi:hypothetical protein
LWNLTVDVDTLVECMTAPYILRLHPFELLKELYQWNIH